MTQYDLHATKVNFTMVPAHYALEQLYQEFGRDLLVSQLDSFKERDEAMKNTAVIPELRYQKGGILQY